MIGQLVTVYPDGEVRIFRGPLFPTDADLEAMGLRHLTDHEAENFRLYDQISDPPASYVAGPRDGLTAYA